ncbi:MAG: hypothetical protein AAGJ18_11965 [Bacteroidota bacterium]
MITKNLFALAFLLAATITCTAQDITSIPNKATLGFDLHYLAINANFSHRISKDFMVGIGVGAGPSNLFVVSNGNAAFVEELASAQLFLSGNDNRDYGFSWEAGYKWSVAVAKNCEESCGVALTSFYFSPFWGGPNLKLGTQVRIIALDNLNFAWTPFILRYTINYPSKRKRRKLLKSKPNNY